MAILAIVNYPGGKNGSGVFQTIINLMPPHKVYIEPFLGGGAILRLKRPAALNIGIDLAPSTIATLREASGKIATSGEASSSVFRIEQGDAFQFLKSYPFSGEELVYCDPPYMLETRSRKNLYQFEMSDRQHARLLAIVTKLRCQVMISGYWTELYAEKLATWNSTNFQAVTRSGRMATEWLWFNFPAPIALHDYRYLGNDFRERERIKRKIQRWTRRLKIMPVLERRALLAALDLASPEMEIGPARAAPIANYSETISVRLSG
jgi:DNA adenine methylase